MSGGPEYKNQRGRAPSDALVAEILSTAKGVDPSRVHALLVRAECPVTLPKSPRVMCDELDDVRTGKVVLSAEKGKEGKVEAVRALQNKLLKCGLLTEQDLEKESGKIGEKTAWAVRTLQRVFRLRPDSVVGKYTMEALDRGCGAEILQLPYANSAYAALTVPDWAQNQPKNIPDVTQEPWYRTADINKIESYLFTAYRNDIPYQVKLYRVAYNVALVREAAEKYLAMQRAAYFGEPCSNTNLGIPRQELRFIAKDWVNSARTPEAQKAVGQRWPGRANPVNRSKHQEGLAVDVANTPGVYKWIDKYGGRFGFARTEKNNKHKKEQHHMEFIGPVSWPSENSLLAVSQD